MAGSSSTDWDPVESGSANEPLLQFFTYTHLRGELQEVSVKFHSLAYWIVDELPLNPERTVALRKLLEAKDAAIRAKLFK
jgi:hypothetical protein